MYSEMSTLYLLTWCTENVVDNIIVIISDSLIRISGSWCPFNPRHLYITLGQSSDSSRTLQQFSPNILYWSVSPVPRAAFWQLEGSCDRWSAEVEDHYVTSQENLLDGTLGVDCSPLTPSPLASFSLVWERRPLLWHQQERQLLQSSSRFLLEGNIWNILISFTKSDEKSDTSSSSHN